MLKLPVLAPPPVALTTLAMVPSPVGRVSANVALVAVLGPALVITRLKVSVPPALGVAVLAVLLMPRSATSPTVMVAVPVLLPGVVSVVPGIGPQLAERLLAARPFTGWADLLRRVKGLGRASALKLSAQGLRVEGQALDAASETR
jgi:competence protein ComEA